jgi:hypothetical protein
VDAGFAGDVVDADDRLVTGLVGQARGARDIADGVEAGDRGAAPLVGDDEAPVEPDAELGQAQPLGVRRNAGRDQHPLGHRGDLGADGRPVPDGHLVRTRPDRLDRNPGVHRDAPPRELPLDEGGHGGVLHR